MFSKSILRKINNTVSSRYQFHTSVVCQTNIVGPLSSIPPPLIKNVSREIDLDRIKSSLAKVNTFAKRRLNEKFPPVIIYESSSDGGGTYRNMTLRELLNYVNVEAHELDAATLAAEAEKKRKRRISRGIHHNNLNDHHHEVHHHGHTSHQVSHHVNHTSNHHTPTHGNGHVYSTGSELSLRDLHRLDYLFNLNEEKSLLVRRHAVLFAMDPVRAVVMSNRLLILAPAEDDPLVETIDQFMKEWVSHSHDHDLPATEEDTVPVAPTDVPNQYLPPPDKTIAFELHAYEALLTVVKAVEFQEYDKVKREVREILDVFQSGSLLSVEVQERMRALKNQLSMMMSRVGSSQRVLQEIASDDEELALMNLTALKNKPSLYNYPLSAEILSTHDDTQELLEAYLIDFNSLASKVEYLRSQIQSAEESVSLRLDTSRNELLITNTHLAVVGCSVGFSAYLSGVFGMNLDNGEWMPPIEGIFAGVFGATFVLIPVGVLAVFSYLTKKGILPQRIKTPCPPPPSPTPAAVSTHSGAQVDDSHLAHGHRYRTHHHHHHQLHSYVSRQRVTSASANENHKIVDNAASQL